MNPRGPGRPLPLVTHPAPASPLPPTSSTVTRASQQAWPRSFWALQLYLPASCAPQFRSHKQLGSGAGGGRSCPSRNQLRLGWGAPLTTTRSRTSQPTNTAASFRGRRKTGAPAAGPPPAPAPPPAPTLALFGGTPGLGGALVPASSPRRPRDFCMASASWAGGCWNRRPRGAPGGWCLEDESWGAGALPFCCPPAFSLRYPEGHQGGLLAIAPRGLFLGPPAPVSRELWREGAAEEGTWAPLRSFPRSRWPQTPTKFNRVPAPSPMVCLRASPLLRSRVTLGLDPISLPPSSQAPDSQLGEGQEVLGEVSERQMGREAGRRGADSQRRGTRGLRSLHDSVVNSKTRSREWGGFWLPAGPACACWVTSSLMNMFVIGREEREGHSRWKERHGRNQNMMKADDVF